MKKMIFLGIISGIILFLSCPVLAAIINVPVDYSTIQSGIDAAYTGDIINVSAGTYNENIILKEGVALQGENPLTTIIIGQDYEPVIKVPDNCTIKGFTIREGLGAFAFHIYCTGSFATIEKNVLISNTIEKKGIFVRANSSPNIINNTMVGFYKAIGIYKDSSPMIKNNIIVDCEIGIIGWDDSNPSIAYNDLYNNIIDYEGCSIGIGNIFQDPLFVSSSVGDYHLGVGSPCIDAGDPDPQYNNSSGSRNDLGAYEYIVPFADDLSLGKAYPNPFKGNFSSEIIFDALTSGSTIKIYTLTGQLVKKIEVADEGRVFWDVKNEQSKKIVSGIYIYVIVDEKGDKKSGKIAIVK